MAAFCSSIFLTEPYIITCNGRKIGFLQAPSDVFYILPPPLLCKAQICARGRAGVSHPGETEVCCQLLHLRSAGRGRSIFPPAFVCVAENGEPSSCTAAFLSDCVHTATSHCVFQACTIIASSLVTFRNLIITSAISSAGVKVPSRLPGNIVVMIAV